MFTVAELIAKLQTFDPKQAVYADYLKRPHHTHGLVIQPLPGVDMAGGIIPCPWDPSILED
jgi:hypothetical protein